jgi:hypothetical protein
MPKFLSTEWFENVEQLTRDAGELNIPKSMKDVVVNLFIDTDEGEKTMCMKGGLITREHINNPDVNMWMPADYAKGLLVKGDWSVGMKGYVARKIKLDGNMRKLIPLQLYKPSKELEELRKKIESITE